MNGFSFVLMIIYLLVNPWSSELSDGLRFIQLHPAVLRDIIIFSVAGSLGQIFIFYMLQRFGSISLVTVTVTRKMFSILLSVFMFGHIISIGQWMTVGVVFFGIGLDAYYSRKQKLAKMADLKTFDDSNKQLLKVTPRKQVRKSPQKEKTTDKPVSSPGKNIENIIESEGSNRRRSLRLKSKQN
jgi:uncharacterized membrane protein